MLSVLSLLHRGGFIVIRKGLVRLWESVGGHWVTWGSWGRIAGLGVAVQRSNSLMVYSNVACGDENNFACQVLPGSRVAALVLFIVLDRSVTHELAMSSVEQTRRA